MKRVLFRLRTAWDWIALAAASALFALGMIGWLRPWVTLVAVSVLAFLVYRGSRPKLQAMHAAQQVDLLRHTLDHGASAAHVDAGEGGGDGGADGDGA